MNSMKHLKEYILENVDIVNEEDLLGLGDDKKDDKKADNKDDKGGDDLLDGGKDDKKDDSSSEDKPKDDEQKDEDPEGDDPKDDKGSEPEIDPELKERAEIKFKIWKDSDRNYWMTADEAKEYGMIDMVLKRKTGEEG